MYEEVPPAARPGSEPPPTPRAMPAASTFLLRPLAADSTVFKLPPTKNRVLYSIEHYERSRILKS